MNRVTINVLPHGEGLELPAYATPLSAGMDVRAALSATLTLQPGQRALIPCGFAMAMPETLEAQVRPRSGLALKHGITVLNAPGTIDADYLGEVGVILYNAGEASFTIERGMRIAQIVFSAVHRVTWHQVNEWSADTANQRQTGGFGSTGVR